MARDGQRLAVPQERRRQNSSQYLLQGTGEQEVMPQDGQRGKESRCQAQKAERARDLVAGFERLAGQARGALPGRIQENSPA